MRKGFTLVEILVVIAISAMLTAITIVYSRNAQRQVALTVETAKVAETILRAKELTLATYATIPGTCGYGVAFNNGNTYSLFAYTPSGAPPCPIAPSSVNPSQRSEVSGGTWNVPLANGVIFAKPSPADAATMVIFYPPQPQTFISNDNNGKTFANITSKVYLETADKQTSSTITINPAGQVTF